VDSLNFNWPHQHASPPQENVALQRAQVLDLNEVKSYGQFRQPLPQQFPRAKRNSLDNAPAESISG